MIADVRKRFRIALRSVWEQCRNIIGPYSQDVAAESLEALLGLELYMHECGLEESLLHFMGTSYSGGAKKHFMWLDS
jgi:hypothetical protein